MPIRLEVRQITLLEGHFFFFFLFFSKFFDGAKLKLGLVSSTAYEQCPAMTLTGRFKPNQLSNNYSLAYMRVGLH